jgi:hypothetical protein
MESNFFMLVILITIAFATPSVASAHAQTNNSTTNQTEPQSIFDCDLTIRYITLEECSRI